MRDGDGRLAIAKFPHQDGEYNIVLWEAVALALAERVGIVVAPWRIETIAGQATLLMRRFDCNGEVRVPFLSAMTVLGANGVETRSYLEFVDMLRQRSAVPKQDMRMLWRRIVFNALISNTEDHLRNHGLLNARPKGWRLSPAYGTNPVPPDIKSRILATTIDLDEATACLDLAMEAAQYFELAAAEARAIAGEVGQAVADWRNIAATVGLKVAEVNRMASRLRSRRSEGRTRVPKVPLLRVA